MKSEGAIKWKLGIFIVAGLVLLVFGLYFIGKQKNLFVSVFQLRSVFKNVSGLKPGNNVRFGGIVVGTVEGIQLITDTSVLVNLSIKDEVRRFIKKDAIATIGSDGLVGDRVVLISPGIANGEPVKDNEVLASRAPVETTQILEGLKTSADNAAQITRQLAEVAYKVNHGRGIIARLLGDSSMGNNLNATMVNLKKGTAGLNENMEAAKHNFLLRGYFKKKKKEEEKKKKEAEERKKESEDNKQTGADNNSSQGKDGDKAGKEGVEKAKG
jgi:phospholipid/cholesterol/gamma-HCH transport system substrate-binding protein